MEKKSPYIIPLPKIYDPRGSLTFLENGQDIMPFEIKRVFWTYDVPAGSERGAHAHKKAEELIVAVSGSFRVNLFDGREWHRFELNRPYEGLYVPAGHWRTLDNFSTGAVAVVMTSILFDEADYIRDYDEFMKTVK